jgi:tetratricopeptide (TPR) repeat protein
MNYRLRSKLDEGLALIKEKKLLEAAAAFEEATRIAPANVLAANNLGFTYYKLGRFADAAVWYERTIALDPRRAIAYANLGDAYAKRNRTPEARKAYQRFLELAPNGKLAPAVRARLASPTLGADAGAR